MDVPTGAGLIVWILVGAMIVGLYLVVRRSRQKSYDAYWQRKHAEAERRRSDPDMRDE